MAGEMLPVKGAAGSGLWLHSKQQASSTEHILHQTAEVMPWKERRLLKSMQAFGQQIKALDMLLAHHLSEICKHCTGGTNKERCHHLANLADNMSHPEGPSSMFGAYSCSCRPASSTDRQGLVGFQAQSFCSFMMTCAH